MPVTEVSAEELKRRLDAGDAVRLLDVREPWEYAIVSLPGSTHIPLAQLPRRLQELSADEPIVALCKSGGRSRRAAEFLQSSGFRNVTNLTGGIDAWIEDVDPSLPSY
ncbi:MAG TPA: rhodanese-like domain-containing protein [Steroidobacteraceae bacterium]|nr:rhodanese-like domain-containing protein [Steroidobacteraceae bacterium]